MKSPASNASGLSVDVRIGSNVTVSNEVIVGDDADIQNGETLF